LKQKGLERRASAGVCLFFATVDTAIEFVELTLTFSFPRAGGGPSLKAYSQENWVPAYAGKGKRSNMFDCRINENEQIRHPQVLPFPASRHV
jgi:hypothetical protein